MLALDELGIPLDVPSVEVIRGEASTPVGGVDLSRGGDVLATVIRRDRFDAMLARAASAAGVEIVQRGRVLDVAQDAGGVRVDTERGSFDAQVLVGADGSGSRVRRAVFGARKETIGRALMTDIAVDPERTPEFTEQRYRFDFRCVSHGINGYSWSFPCLIGGAPHLNVGIYDQRPREFVENGGEQSRMIAELVAAFPELPLDGLKHHATRWQSFPIRWFDATDSYAPVA